MPVSAVQDRTFKTFTAPIGLQIKEGTLEIIQRPGWYQVIDSGTKAPESNEVILSILEDKDAEQVIDQTIAQYRKLGNPVKWCVGPLTRPFNMGSLLERRGFKSWDVRGMACNPLTFKMSIPKDVHVEPLTEENIEAYVDAQLTSFPFPKAEFATTRMRFILNFRRLLPTTVGRYSYHLAYCDNRPAGTAGLAYKGDYAYLFGGQVVPEFRGRGIYKALIEARLEKLRQRNIDLAVTQAREATSAPILEKLGFDTIYRSKCYLLNP